MAKEILSQEAVDDVKSTVSTYDCKHTNSPNSEHSSDNLTARL